MTITRSTLTVDGGELPMTIARGTGTGAAIVIMPSAFGVGPDLEAQMEELAADARVVVTYDPFFRDDPGLVPYEDMPRIMARIGALDRARTYRDLSALITHVRAEHPGTRVVMLGICFGGPFGLAAAADARIDALVVWHGSWMERFLDRAAEMGCPMSLHFGSVDPVTPPAAIDAVRA
ncbi:dienelactone hydrolase family protein, partial [Myxococcota bacterium]|nr:dienelactone hydrolase family protein [Myxococcota bacterium]